MRNLPVAKRERDDGNVICIRVNQVIRDVLKLSDVRPVKAARKSRSDDKPGLVLVTLESCEQNQNVLQNKNTQNSKDHPQVYIDSASR